MKYVPEPEDSVLLHTAMMIYRRFNRYPQAMRLALMLNDIELTREIFISCPDRLMQKQLAFMLGRQQVFLDLEDSDCPDHDDLTDIMSNVHLNTNFLALGREVGVGGGHGYIKCKYYLFLGGWGICSWTLWNLKCLRTYIRLIWSTQVCY